MNITADVILIGALAAIWLTAGLLVDGLPTARSAAELRRRAGLLSALVGAGAVVFMAVPLTPATSTAPTAALLMAVPALVVLTATWRRLGQVRRGAGAFATAPLAPVPPGLRAAAAHPLIAAPLQVTGLAALIGLPIAAGLVAVPEVGADLAGIAITVAGLAALGIAVRHGLRHSRLSLRVVAPLKRVKQI